MPGVLACFADPFSKHMKRIMLVAEDTTWAAITADRLRVVDARRELIALRPANASESFTPHESHGTPEMVIFVHSPPHVDARRLASRFRTFSALKRVPLIVLAPDVRKKRLRWTEFGPITSLHDAESEGRLQRIEGILRYWLVTAQLPSAGRTEEQARQSGEASGSGLSGLSGRNGR